MSLQVINNNEQGGSVRTKLNNMFTELYNAIPIPLKLQGLTANTQQVIPANSWIGHLFLIAVTGTPTLRIGTTPNGTDIMGDTVINSSMQELTLDQYFENQTTLYFTFVSGTGNVNVRIDIINNFF